MSLETRSYYLVFKFGYLFSRYSELKTKADLILLSKVALLLNRAKALCVLATGQLGKESNQLWGVESYIPLHPQQRCPYNDPFQRIKDHSKRRRVQ